MIRAFSGAFVSEWRRILSDGGALLILAGAIAIYAVVYPVPYLPEIAKDVPAAVVDLDRSDLSRMLVRMLDADDFVRVAAEMPTRAEAEKLLRRGAVESIVVIPDGFQRSVARGEVAWIGAWSSSAYFLAYRQVLTGIVESAGTLSAGIEIRRLEAGGMTPEEARAARDPLPLVTRPLFNATEGYASYVVPAVLVLILQQTLLIGIGLLGGTRRERGESLGRQPVGVTVATLLGRAATYLVLYSFHAVFYFGVVMRLYEFPQRGAAVRLAVFFVPFALAVIFLGLAAGELFSQREVAIPALLFTSLPAIFVAGFAWPVEQLPRWLALIAYGLPSTAGIAGFLRLTSMGASLRQVGAELAILSLLTVVYFLAACVTARRSESSDRA